MEVMVAAGAINRRAKLWSNCYYQQTNTELLQAGCPSRPPINSVAALKGLFNQNYCRICSRKLQYYYYYYYYCVFSCK